MEINITCFDYMVRSWYSIRIEIPDATQFFCCLSKIVIFSILEFGSFSKLSNIIAPEAPPPMMAIFSICEGDNRTGTS